MTVKLLMIVMLVLATAHDARAATDSAANDSPASTVSFLPEFHGSFELMSFLNHKSEDYFDRYLVQCYVDLDVRFFRYGDALFFGLSYCTDLIMGRKYEGIIFHPHESWYAGIAYIEYRKWGRAFFAGLDHRCYHEIDRSTRHPIYWNQLFVSAASDNFIHSVFRARLNNESDLPKNRIAWRVYAGYFLKDFFGLVEMYNLSGGHDLSSEARVEARYCFLATNRWLFSATARTRLFADTSRNFFWTQQTGLEAMARAGQAGIAFFADFICDFPRENPIVSKDRLIQLGVRVFY